MEDDVFLPLEVDILVLHHTIRKIAVVRFDSLRSTIDMACALESRSYSLLQARMCITVPIAVQETPCKTQRCLRLFYKIENCDNKAGATEGASRQQPRPDKLNRPGTD